VSDFNITSTWLPQGGRNEADATFCSLLIKLGKINVTEFVDLHRNRNQQLEIPAYFLAEWIAENWWPLLWEPTKNEEEEDVGGEDNPLFLARHSILTGQHGFVLPKLKLVPQGNSIHITARAWKAELAGVAFLNSASATLPRSGVEEILKEFLLSVVGRLDEQGVGGTDLQDLWKELCETDHEEAQFCRLIGALGLSPYDVDDTLAGLIERLHPVLGERLLMDICLASTPQSFPAAAGLAAEAIALTSGAKTSTLSPIETVVLPRDVLTAQAHRRGLTGAEFVRQRLNIKDTDPSGATKVFEALQIDTSVRGYSNTNRLEDALITGAVVRDESSMRIALLQATEPKRRFAGARAIFAAWSAENHHEGRLLTSAVTRDQQANRAFATELTAPRALLKKKAVHGNLSRSAIYELADELRIGADVISKHAINNGINAPRIGAGLV
jgi:hypothetical protein